MMTPNSPKTLRVRSAWLYFTGLFLVILAAKLALIGHFGNSTPFWDQWDGEADAIFIPVLEHHFHPASLFDAHCEHRIFFSRVLALGLLKLNGIWDPKVEMVTQALLHVSCLVLLIAFCGRVLTAYSARLLFGFFTVVIFSIPFGWENTLWGFQSQFYFVSLWGLIGIWCCWAHPTLSRGWWLGVFVFSLGLISMAGGLFAPAVTLGLVVLRAAHNRSDWRRQAVGAAVLGTLAIVGFLLVRHVPGHDALKAHSLLQFLKVLTQIIGWPTKIGWLAPVFLAPLVLLLVWALWQRRPARDPAWLLITLGLWGEAQATAIAYGRALGFDASRYTDNFSLTLCVSLACLLYLGLALRGRLHTPLIVFGIGWYLLVSGSLLYVGGSVLPHRILEKHRQSLMQEAHLRAFVANGYIAELKDKPRLDIPYPDPVRLATLLAQPTLREILPANIRAALNTAQCSINPAGSFRPDGYAKDTPGRPDEAAWGSYNRDTGEKATGVIELKFPAGSHTSWLKISVTGDPSASGMSFALIDANGRTRIINPPRGSGFSWHSVFFYRPAGAFTLRVTDDSPSAWLAFTLPREVGPASLVAGFLQDQAGWLAIMGMALVGFAVWADPARQLLSKEEFPRSFISNTARLIQDNRWLRRGLFLVPVAIFTLLAWRQHLFVDHYAVNMMFWDQWDFYSPFFNKQDAWAIFSHQHGPHRQGAGFLVTHVLAGLSHWNSRWDAFGVSFSLMLAALCGLAVVLKCGCRTWLALPVVALIFFNIRQYEGFVGASNLSHGAVPMLLFMLYALCWFIKTPFVRLTLLSVLTLPLIFTGFGVFVGLLTPVLALVEALHAFKARQIGRAWLALATLALSAVSWSLFAQGYVFAPAVDGFHFPYERPWEYFYFMGLMLANFYGIPGHQGLTICIGLLIVATLTGLCVKYGWRIVRHGIDGQRIGIVIFCLSAYALIYCLNTAVGRVCLGLDGAPAASRYVTLMIPGALALYLGLSHTFPRKAATLGIIYVMILGAGTLVLRESDWTSIHWFHDGREAWKKAYLETHDEVLANQRANFSVYPTPGTITGRLNYLEAHHLNLFYPVKSTGPEVSPMATRPQAP